MCRITQKVWHNMESKYLRFKNKFVVLCLWSLVIAWEERFGLRGECVCMYICIHTCINVCMCAACTCVHTFTCIRVYISMCHVYIHVHISAMCIVCSVYTSTVYVCVHMCVHSYAHVCTRCMYICACDYRWRNEERDPCLGCIGESDNYLASSSQEAQVLWPPFSRFPYSCWETVCW